MASFKAFACFTISFALCLGTSKAEPYTFTTNAMVTSVYAQAGYVQADYVKRWVAEGDAIYEALPNIYNLHLHKLENDGIEFIVASTGGNTSTYIYGEAKRLENKYVDRNQKPSKIIVVYTLNYVAGEFAATEFLDFTNALEKLRDAAAKQVPPIEVVVKQFRPVADKKSTLVPAYDYHDYEKLTMTEEQENTQHGQIDDLHKKVGKVEFITTLEFEELLTNTEIRKIVDGIVGSGIKTVDGDNQLLTAIPRAQIRIMAKAILAFKTTGQKFLVISNDNPSGMDENGNWTIHKLFWYPVNYILSCVWHKKLVNSEHLQSELKAFVLDIKYNGQRLFDLLLQKLKAPGLNTDPKLLTAVQEAEYIYGGEFVFEFDNEEESSVHNQS